MVQRIGRMVVRGEPEPVFTATEDCVVKMFVPPKSPDDETENPVVVVQVDVPPRIPYGDENSAILPFNWGLKLYLDKGQTIWAVSPGETMVVFSAIPVQR
jgi:hypothetical protein